MEKRKVYIFLTYQMMKVTGVLMYTAGKAGYLEKIGWDVRIFSEEGKGETSVVPSLSKHVKFGSGCRFLEIPPYRLNAQEQEKVLQFMLRKLNLTDLNKYEIIIESHYDFTAYWAELLAARLEARHFFVTCNEFFHPIPKVLNKNYGESLDYFYFKLQRNEIVSGSKTIQALFRGYKDADKIFTEIPSELLVEMRPIQDIDFPQIEKIPRSDWNICHIGRAAKLYVPYLIKGVEELAKRHPDKKINFIMVGNADEITELLDKTFENLPNVTLTLLGDMVPIPKILFSKVDVVCAISQSAMFAADEGVLTICASVIAPEGTPGVLGYDTAEQIRGENSFSYIEALENVLVKRLYDDKEYSLPKLLPSEYYYEQFWKLVDKASKKKEYYTERLSRDRIRKWFSPFPFASIARGTKIILVGNTEMAADYRIQVMFQQNCTVEISPDGVKQLDEKPYCEILATVDEHPENFDDSVVGLERLKQLDYDAIILTAYTSDIPRLREKILEMVPQMADRIICNLEFVNIYHMKHKETRLFEE